MFYPFSVFVAGVGAIPGAGTALVDSVVAVGAAETAAVGGALHTSVDVGVASWGWGFAVTGAVAAGADTSQA